MSEPDFEFDHERDGDPQAKAARSQEARWEAEDLAALMATKRGRRTMWRLLSHAGVYRQSFTGEALSTAFNEGQRSVGLRLMAILTAACPSEYALMVQERTNVRS
jgi:hypothetical protein